MPRLDDRYKVLKDNAGQGRVGGVAVRREADGFGFWEVEILVGGWGWRDEWGSRTCRFEVEG